MELPLLSALATAFLPRYRTVLAPCLHMATMQLATSHLALHTYLALHT